MTFLLPLATRGKQPVPWQWALGRGEAQPVQADQTPFSLPLMSASCAIYAVARGLLLPATQRKHRITRTPAIFQTDSLYRHRKTPRHKFCNYGAGVCTPATIKAGDTQKNQKTWEKHENHKRYESPWVWFPVTLLFLTAFEKKENELRSSKYYSIPS